MEENKNINENVNLSMHQTCPYMQQFMCCPEMMYPQQMQQPTGYPGMTGQMQQPMVGQMSYPMRDDEEWYEEAVPAVAHGHGGHGGYHGHGHYGHYYPNYYYGGYPYYPYYPYPTPY